MNKVFINGQCYDWSSIKFTIFGVPLIGITKIDYTRDRDSENLYGAGNEPIGFSYKNFIYSGSITVYMDEVKRILQTAPNRSILEIPPFGATVIYTGAGVPYTTDTLNNIRITKDPTSASQNDSSIMCTLPFIFAGLKK